MGALRKSTGLAASALFVAAMLAACGESTVNVARENTRHASVDQLTDGCARADNPIAIPGQDAPPVHMMGGGGQVAYPVTTEPAKDGQLETMSMPQVVGGLKASGIHTETANENEWGPKYGSVFYSESDPNGTTAPEFMDKGGIRVQITPAAGYWSFEELQRLLGDRLLTVQVGEDQGRLLWADPDPNGERFYSVYWITKDNSAYWLAERKGPAEALNAARDVACSK